MLAREVLLRVSVSLLDVTSNIEGVTRGLRDGETVVESDSGGYDADAWAVSVMIIESEFCV